MAIYQGKLPIHLAASAVMPHQTTGAHPALN